jgi:hypothetical protein
LPAAHSFSTRRPPPFQILVRAEPVDLEGHLHRVQSRAEVLAEPLATIARDYVSFLQTLAQQRTLLERHCYVVVPDRTLMPAVTLGRRVRQLFKMRSEPSEIDEATGIPATWRGDLLPDAIRQTASLDAPVYAPTV